MYNYSEELIDSLMKKAIFEKSMVILPKMSHETLSQTLLCDEEQVLHSNIEEISEPKFKKIKLNENKNNLLKLVILKDEFSGQLKCELNNKSSDKSSSLHSNNISRNEVDRSKNGINNIPKEHNKDEHEILISCSKNNDEQKISMTHAENLLPGKNNDEHEILINNVEHLISTQVKTMVANSINEKSSADFPSISLLNNSDKCQKQTKNTVNENKEHKTSMSYTETIIIPTPLQSTLDNKILNSNSKDDRQISNRNIEPIASENLIGKIRVVDIAKLVGNKKQESNQRNSSVKNNECLTRSNIVQRPTIHTSLSLNYFESLYNKYFSGAFKDSIFIIASILNVITSANIHHKERMDSALKIKNETQRQKLRYNANKMRDEHKKILELKFKDIFQNIVSTFEDTDFERAFQLFFLSILTIIQLLDQPKLNAKNVFKNVWLLLNCTLKSINFENRKVYDILKSKRFRADCTEIITLIEDCREVDPSVTRRLSVFFLSTVKCNAFKSVIHAVTHDSDDLESYLEEAVNNSRIFSKSKSTENHCAASVVSRHQDSKTLIKTTDRNSFKDEKTILKNWIIIENNNKTLENSKSSDSQINSETHRIPIVVKKYGNKVNENINTEVLPSISGKPALVVNVPSSTVNEGPLPVISNEVKLKSTLQNNHFIKKAVIKPTIRNVQIAKSTEQKLSQVHQEIFKKNISQDIGMSPEKRIKHQSIVLQSTVDKKNLDKIVNNSLLCSWSNCSKSSTLMCSNCRSVSYCSLKCQEVHWHKTHRQECSRLSEEKNTVLPQIC